jgi:3-dehydroquinate synthetase
VPTSLLAMVDSSIGGKTGVDAPFGKNMVGAFKQPDLVVIDTACLATLPQAELSNGFAEIIKAALIKGGVFWNELCAGTWQWTNRTFELTHLTRAIELKREIVEEDPFERGRRALLNLGHTFGHGIEFWSHFKIAHGQAVALGMICAVRASIALGLCDPALEEQLIAQLKRAGLPIHMKQTRAGKLDVDATWKLMQNDKKKKEGKVRFVLIRAPGDCFVSDQVDEALAKRVLATLNADDSKREEGKKG